MIDVVALGGLLIDFAAKSADAAGYPTMAANPGGAPGNFLAGDICYRYELLAQHLQREIGAKALFRDKMDVQIAPVAENPNVGVLSAAEVVFSRFFTV